MSFCFAGDAQVLHLHLRDSQLPVPGAKLWSDFMLPNRPAGAHLDMKKTSFKKLSKFLKSRKDMGLISCKEDKHSNDTVLTKINRSHKEYTGFQTYDQSEEAATAQVPESAPQAVQIIGGGGAAVGAGSGLPGSLDYLLAYPFIILNQAPPQSLLQYDRYRTGLDGLLSS